MVPCVCLDTRTCGMIRLGWSIRLPRRHFLQHRVFAAAAAAMKLPVVAADADHRAGDLEHDVRKSDFPVHWGAFSSLLGEVRSAAKTGRSGVGNPHAIWLPRAIGGCRIGRMAAARTLAVRWICNRPRNVKWVAQLGRLTTGSPVVSQGKVLIGTTWEDGKEACSLCLDEKTGKRLGAFICPRPAQGKSGDIGRSVPPRRWTAIGCTF